jgi:hypothetical protein
MLTRIQCCAVRAGFSQLAHVCIFEDVSILVF